MPSISQEDSHISKVTSSPSSNHYHDHHHSGPYMSLGRNPKDVDNSLADTLLDDHTQYISSDRKVFYIDNKSMSQTESNNSAIASSSVIDVTELNKTEFQDSSGESLDLCNIQVQDEEYVHQNDKNCLPSPSTKDIVTVTSTSTTSAGRSTENVETEAFVSRIEQNHPPETIKKNFLRICAISDTHQRHHAVTESIPVCDVLIHTGDIFYLGRRRTYESSLKILQDFNEWLESLPARHVFIIGGNHDYVLQGMSSEQINEQIFPSERIHYLCCDYIDCEGYRFIGVPTSRGRSRNKAFQGDAFHLFANEFIKNISAMDSGSQSQHQTPPSTTSTTTATTTTTSPRRILLTHSRQERWILEAIKPNIHFWGHEHGYYGVQYAITRKSQNPKAHKYWSICSCIMDNHYRSRNRPIVIDVPI